MAEFTTRVFEDTDNTELWTTITDTFNADGVWVLRNIVFDDGRLVETRFVDGSPSVTRIEDAQDAYDWQSIVRDIGDDSTPTVETRLFDDGRLAEFTFNGFGFKFTDSRVDDLGNAYSWNSIDRVYDPTGAYTTASTKVHDSGAVETITASGVPGPADLGEDVTGTDADEVLAVNSSYVFDNTTFMGEQTTVIASYEMGLGDDQIALEQISDLMLWDLTIEDAGGSNDSLSLDLDDLFSGFTGTYGFDWVRDLSTEEWDLVISITGEAGDLHSVTVKGQGSDPDNRIESFEFDGLGSFTADELEAAYPIPSAQVTLSDTEGTKGWDTITDTRNDEGDLVLREMLLDDGRQIDTAYLDGTRTGVRFEDTEDDYAWTTIVKTYDDDGTTVLSETKLWDDGRIETSETSPVTGVTTLTETDGADAVPWDTRETVRAEDGTLQSQTTNFDDGRVVETGYTDGVRSSIEITDGGNAFSWDSITKTYAPDGTLTGETKLFDDGREAVTSYEGGARTETVTTDVEDAYDWLTITTIYDDTGAVEETIVEGDPEEDLALVI